MAALTLCCLGNVAIALNAHQITALNTKTQALLFFLALETGRPQRRDALAGLLWPEQPELAARNSLRQSLFQLQRVLGQSFLEVTPLTIQFNRAADSTLDAAQFTNWISETESHLHRSCETCRACNQRLQSAADLYRGPLLGDLFLKDSAPFQEWVLVKREQFARQASAILDRLVAYYARRAEFPLMERAARQQLAVDSFREAAHCHLMRALEWQGERSGAIAQYAVCRQILQSEFGIEPSLETTTLYEEIREGTLVRPRPLAAARVPLQLTSFIGRQHEVQQVRQLLTTTRLLTLTGTGGCGKTRLAIEVARDVAEDYPDGVWFVELDALADPARVPQRVANVLGVREQPGTTLLDLLLDYARSRLFLLVLDNCEHLAEACAMFADRLLRVAPQSQILATSREALAAEGEQIYPVPSLQAPDLREATRADTWAQVESVQLFVARARNVNPGFELTDENAFSVAQICRELDGNPLAIELAAVLTKELSVEQIAQRLAASLQMLTKGTRTGPERHHTLRATIDWSYSLLTSQERALFGRLAVFAGGWTLGAAEAVCGDEALPARKICEHLRRLVDKSLVIHNEQVERYRMLETIRQFAREKFEASPEASRIQAAHLDFFTRFGERAARQFRGPEVSVWLGWLAADHANVQAALAWSAQSTAGAERGLNLAACLIGLYQILGLVTEEHYWLQELLRRAGVSLRPEMRIRALNALGSANQFMGEPRAARSYFEQACALARELDDKPLLADALWNLGDLASQHSDWRAARLFLEESLRLSREVGNDEAVSFISIRLSVVVYMLGEHELGHQLLQQAETYFSRIRSLFWIANANYFLGHFARWEGDLPAARAIYSKAIRLLHESKSAWGMFYALMSFAFLAGAEEKYARAARLFGAADALGKTMGTVLVPFEQVEFRRYTVLANRALGSQRFSAEWNAGCAMTMEEAIQYTLEDASRC